jgi:hypothetical protein
VQKALFLRNEEDSLGGTSFPAGSLISQLDFQFTSDSSTSH